MSKLETPKSWQQAENKRGRGIFKSISHFSDSHLLSKLLSRDSWDNPHKDSWPVSETKTNKRCRTAISHPWLEADCGLALLFPLLDFAVGFFIFHCESAPLDSFSPGQLCACVCSQYAAALRTVFSPSQTPRVFFNGCWNPCMANLSYCQQACFLHLPLMQFCAYRYLQIKGWKLLQRCISDSCALNTHLPPYLHKCLV